jgi:hypothetical protein
VPFECPLQSREEVEVTGCHFGTVGGVVMVVAAVAVVIALSCQPTSKLLYCWIINLKYININKTLKTRGRNAVNVGFMNSAQSSLLLVTVKLSFCDTRICFP